MNRVTNGFVLLLAMCLAGCSGGASHERTVNADGRSVGVSRLTTPYPPKETIRRAQSAAQRLGLKGDSSGFLGFGGGDWSVNADHYSATTSAKSAAGETISFTAKWVADNRSELTVKSDLGDAQHKHLVQQVQSAMKDTPPGK